MTREIIYFFSTICPKCIQPSRWLKEVTENNNELTLTKYHLLLDIKKVREYNVRNLPTIIIGDTRLEGRISRKEFDSALKKIM
jgi:protein-disulfide isomerase